MIGGMIQPGREIENYRIDGVIGKGGMGTIYRATDVNLMRPVAVKVMHAELAEDPAFQGRFLQEARAAAASTIPLSSASTTSGARMGCSTSSWSWSTV